MKDYKYKIYKQTKVNGQVSFYVKVGWYKKILFWNFWKTLGYVRNSSPYSAYISLDYSVYQSLEECDRYLTLALKKQREEDGLQILKTEEVKL